MLIQATLLLALRFGTHASFCGTLEAQRPNSKLTITSLPSSWPASTTTATTRRPTTYYYATSCKSTICFFQLSIIIGDIIGEPSTTSIYASASQRPSSERTMWYCCARCRWLALAGGGESEDWVRSGYYLQWPPRTTAWLKTRRRCSLRDRSWRWLCTSW
jgi:hypothetical protein